MDSLPNDLLGLVKNYLPSDQFVFLFETEDVQHCESIEEACQNSNWNSILYHLDYNRYKDSYLTKLYYESAKMNNIELKNYFEYLYYSKSKYSGYYDKRFFVDGCKCNELDINVHCICIRNTYDEDCPCRDHICLCEDCHKQPEPERLRTLGIRSRMMAYDARYIFSIEVIENNLTVFSGLSEYIHGLYACTSTNNWLSYHVHNRDLNLYDIHNRDLNLYDVRDRYLKLYNVLLDHYIDKYKLYNFDKDAYRHSKYDADNIPKPLSKADVIAYHKKSNN